MASANPQEIPNFQDESPATRAGTAIVETGVPCAAFLLTLVPAIGAGVVVALTIPGEVPLKIGAGVVTTLGTEATELYILLRGFFPPGFKAGDLLHPTG